MAASKRFNQRMSRRRSDARKIRLGSRFEVLEPRNLLANVPIITEFMASNQKTLEDGNGESSDWVEIHNPSDVPVDLSDHRLTDRADDLSRWTLPRVVLDPHDYLVIFASGQSSSDYVDGAGNLHTTFSLKASGEYLALVSPGGSIVSEFGSQGADFPEQYGDVSYGRAKDADFIGYMTQPTPGAINVGRDEVFAGLVAPVEMSVGRGFHDAPFELEISSSTPGAVIWYTTDGSTPDKNNGKIYRQPLSIDTTTTLRAVALKPGNLPSQIATYSYVFVAEVPRQSPEGLPPLGFARDGLEQHRFEYGMDPDIVDHDQWGPLIHDALMDLPSLAIVTDLENLFDIETGIFFNQQERGREWERPVSLELLNPDGRKGFQIEAGIRIRGCHSRSPANPKYSLRLFFRKKCGGLPAEGVS